MILGSAVTDSTLKTDPRYINELKLTEKLLSSYALEQRASTDYEVMKVVNGMKDEYGAGTSNLLRIFNASGERLFLRDAYHVRGNTWKYPFDMVIENGQWSVVLIVHTAYVEGMAGGVVYRTENNPKDIFCGWDIPYVGRNTVKAEIREVDYWKESANRTATHKAVNSGPSIFRSEAASSALPHEYKVTMQIANGTSPVTDVIFGRTNTLK